MKFANNDHLTQKYQSVPMRNRDRVSRMCVLSGGSSSQEEAVDCQNHIARSQAKMQPDNKYIYGKKDQYKLNSYKFSSNKIGKNIMNQDNQYEGYALPADFIINNMLSNKKVTAQFPNKTLQIRKQTGAVQHQKIRLISDNLVMNDVDFSKQNPENQQMSGSENLELSTIKKENNGSSSISSNFFRLNKNILNLSFDTDSEEEPKRTDKEQQIQRLPQNIKKQKKQKKQKKINKQQSLIYNIINSVSMKSSKSQKHFIHQQLAFNQIMHICFQRHNQGVKYFAPQYHAFFQNDFTHIISAKKIVSPKFQMVLSLDRNIFNDKNSESYCGTIAGNFSNTSFSLQMPKNQGSEGGVLCTAVFKEEKKSAVTIPKCYQAYILKQGINYQSLEGISGCFKQLKSLDQLYKFHENKEKIHYFRNKKPEFREDLNAYFLNFRGRISKASVKNFILQDPKSGRQIMMFGRGTGNSFNLQYSHPLKPVVAFALALPHFSHKLLS